MTVIYIDMLLALNLFIDFLLLSATAKVLERPTKNGRLVLGALLGSVSSLSILLPPLSPFVSALIKLSAALVMVGIGFSFGNGWLFCKTVIVMFVISAVFGGICEGVYLLLAPTGFLVQSGIVYYDIPPLLPLVLTSASYGILCLYDRLTKKRVALGHAYKIEVCHAQKCIVLRAMYDSGHSLCDRFSGAPVIIVRRSALSAFENVFDDTVGTIRYIPFSSIGGDGVLKAFRPEKTTVFSDGKHADISGVWIAVTDSIGRGEYDALIGPAIAQTIVSYPKKETLSCS